MKKHGPISRDCNDDRYSECSTSKLEDLDWGNWFLDSGGYIHVHRWNREEGDTFHRVYPKGIANHEVRRVSMVNGILHWLHDKRKKG